MKQDLLFIGIGGAGCNILYRIHKDIAKLFIDTDFDVVEKYAGLRIGGLCCGKYSAGGDIILGENAVKESKEEILNAIQKFDSIIIIAPSGGGTSSGSTLQLVKLLIDNNKKVQLITNMPFDIEGERKANIAASALKAIQELCKVKIFDNIDYKQLRNVTYNDVLNLQNAVYIEKIEKLID